MKKSIPWKQLLERERIWVEATENICRLMERDNVSRKELADRLGTTPANITKLLGGTNNFQLSTLADIFHALGRSAHLSYGPACEFPLFTSEESDEYRKLADLPPWDLRLLSTQHPAVLFSLPSTVRHQTSHNHLAA